MATATPAKDRPLLRNLNTAQLQAVTASSDTLAILAGPGSGKTHTLTSRVAWLIDHVGYSPCDVIVATFTVKAAREMKERIGKALGEERAKKVVLGTFHSIARRYLVVYGDRIGLDKKFAIADDGDTRAVIKRICKRLGLALDPAFAKDWISKKKVRLPEDAKFTKMGPMDMEMQTVFEEYTAHMKRSNLLDYDDLLVRGVELLRDHPSCVRNVQTVLVDEYQDTNGIQYELTKLFASARGRITVVGDPDQSIYGWRSAEIRNLHRLLEQYPKTVSIALEENYRSSQSILDASLKVIQQDSERFEKVLKPTHHKGTRPVLRTLDTMATEGDWVVSEIRRAISMSGAMLKHDDIAILLRSAFLSRHIESALGKSGIPYRMIGGLKFYERIEIKLILDYLRAIHQPNNNDVLIRIINNPKRGVGEATLKKLLEEAETSKQSVWTLLLDHCRGRRSLPFNFTKGAEQKINGGLIRLIFGLRHRIERPTSSAQAGGGSFGLKELVEELVDELNVRDIIKEAYPEENEARLANIDELITLVGDFVQEQEFNEEINIPQLEGEEEVTTDPDILGKFLANVALAADAQTNDKDGEKKPHVTISTIHAAKGLEWPVVFVPAVYNGSLPHSRSEDQDEERRLLYVAMTRAKALLYLSVPWFTNSGKVERSDFIPDDIVKFFSLRGPSFEQGMLETIAKILGRKPPSLKEIYADLPDMLSVEDDTQPDFPTGYTTPKGYSGAAGASWGAASRQRGKRGKVWAEEDPLEYEKNQTSWRKDYATTMERASSFTVAATALPGFTTAGAHYSTLSAAEAARGGKVPAGARRTGGASTNRPADQSSLSAFLKRSAAAGPEPDGPHVPQRIVHAAQVGMSFNQPLPPSVAKEMAARGLQDVKRRVLKRRSDGAPVADADASQAQEEGRGATKRTMYPGFSSSPPRPPVNENQAPVPAAARQAAEDKKMGFTRAARPASLHATTMARVSGRVTGGAGPQVIDLTGDDGGPGVPEAPMAMARVERVRKPFKPLTMNRNGNFARQ
ncbi:related to ATP-dependent DNA helicase [Cephalotrichum gorgonifer]|uniref:DNA 3'-5' helicase n=1 Tax=Cephalotrichum gorgonifer TaxID=2041049 RepID=A0AAE8N3U0_9PEZI|nr:related to ATP-dependent DNA helicase [Cephalotrichum gorgonifer]